MDLKSSVSKVRKAIVAAAATALMAVVSKYVHLDVVALQTLIDAAIVSLLVWAVPNSKDLLDE